MTDRTCPKCGAEWLRQNADEKAGNTRYTRYKCGTVELHDGTRSKATLECLRRQLAAMTERAEKAEAQVIHLLMRNEALALALGRAEAEGESPAKPCQTCDLFDVACSGCALVEVKS